MTLNLAEKYRPTSFEDFKGSDLVVSMLRRMAENKTLPNSMIFTGSKGVGKTSMCRILNTSMNGEDSSLSYMEIDAASNSGVDNIRSIQETVRYSHPGNWRIVVLDEAHNLSNAAFNSLLKVLEDPPENTTFILVTTQPESIPDTVRSRSMIFRFREVGVRPMVERLVEVYKQENLSFDPQVLARIAQVSAGSMRNALVTLQQITLIDMPTVDVVNELSGYTVSTQDLLYVMLEGKLSGVEREVSNMFSESLDVDNFLLSMSHTLKEFHSTNLIGNGTFLKCMEILWSMRKIKRSNDAVARTQFEAGIFAMFLHNFWDGEEEVEEEGSTPITEEAIEALQATP